jgi:hypothetical protein
MDAALIGVVGSLVGVAVGAGTQHYQALIRRNWEFEDSEREKRRELYAQCISAANEYKMTVIQYLALLDGSASEEVQRSKRQEITDIDQKLRMMDGPLSMVASERVEIKRVALSSMLGLFYMLETSDGKGGLDVEWVQFLANQYSELISEMRDDLVRKPRRRSGIKRLFWKRLPASRQRPHAPLPSSVQRLAEQGGSLNIENGWKGVIRLTDA